MSNSGNIKRFLFSPVALALWTVLALLAPNIVLDITEPWPLIAKAANILLPLGFFTLCFGLWRRSGAVVWLLFPFMVFAGFQLVLSYLYGESIIAVDMFLNVVTTNVSEATELLRNLVGVMVAVVVLYIPALVWGVIHLVKGVTMSQQKKHLFLMSGAMTLAAGALLAVIAIAAEPSYRFNRQTFPVNVIENLKIAVDRTEESANYPESSKDFTYGSTPTRDPGEREVYVLFIGETSRAMDWEILGYDRDTNPCLSRRSNLFPLSNSISESNTTHKSVPMLMSYLHAGNFNSISESKSIITAFKEAGYHTCFFSNQRPNRSYTEFFGNEADEVEYIEADEGTALPDGALLPLISKAIADTASRKLLIVAHSYGSHFLYRDRYPREFARFMPDNPKDASEPFRDELINSYDNSIRYTDYILDSVISQLEKTCARCALYYSADHGEDIFDDERGRFLHASPNPTYYQVHVASLVWLSDSVRSESPEMFVALQRNRGKFVSPQKSLFPTAMQVAGIVSPLVTDSLSLVSEDYHHAPPQYLNDLNEALPLMASGLKEADKQLLQPLI